MVVRMNRICLIFPPIDQEKSKPGLEEIGTLPPLGLLSIATYLKENGVKGVSILDGQPGHLSLEEILRELYYYKPDIVGIAPIIGAYENALEIADYSKRQGSKIYLGGHYATGLAQNIIKKRNKSIDGIICYDGEEAMLKCVNGEDHKNIPNLVYWQDGNIQTNPIELIDLSEVPIPNRDFVVMEK